MFENENHIKYHVEIAHPKAKIKKCSLCKETFHGGKFLKLHIEVAHGSENNFKCDFCEKAYKNPEGLKAHILNKHTKFEPIRCYFCPKILTTPQKLRYHVQKVHEEAKFQCETCNKGFLSQSLLNIHEKTHQGDRIREFACNLCEKAF